MTIDPTIKGPTYLRAFPTMLQRTGARQLTGRLVPYNEATDVLDELPGGEMDIYREGFRPGAFAPQANTRAKGVLNKIGLVHRHDGGLGYLGPFVALREQPDGLWGDVDVLRSRADDVEDLIAAGVDELSVEFRLPRANHTVEEGGVRWRTRAHLDNVALEPKGAYSGARVAAFRAEVDELAKEQAEAAQAAAAEAAAAEAARARQAADIDAAVERRRRFEEMTARYDRERARQDELVRSYGVTVPPHGGLPRNG